jgi:hypothetical protein
MPIDGYESRTIPRSPLSPLLAVFAVLTWPARWPFEVLESWREDHAFASGIDAAWAYCESVWEQPYADAWCQLIHTPSRPCAPRSAFLRRRFARAFSHHHDFLCDKARSKNPILAAYAVMCCPDPNSLPPDILQRAETLILRDWFHEAKMPFGDWVRWHIEEFNRCKELDDEADSPTDTNVT